VQGMPGKGAACNRKRRGAVSCDRLLFRCAGMK